MSTSYQTSYRYKGSIIRQRGNAWQVETNLGGRRKRCTKSTKTEAQKYAAKMADETKQDGARALQLTNRQREEAIRALDMFPTEEIRQAARDAFEIIPYDSERRDVSEALAMLRGDISGSSLDKPRHTPLAEAARFWMRHHPEGQTPPSLGALLDDYLEAKKHRRPGTIYEIKNKVGRFCRSFPSASVVDITSDDIDAWLDANTETLSNRRKYFRLLHAYFAYACRKWRLESNPTDNVYIDRGEQDEILPQAYSVQEVSRIMQYAVADKDAGTVVPVLAIGFFTGLRPSEIQLLTWEDVDFEERHIRVRPETAKRRRQRFVEMSDNLVAWLASRSKPTGRVAPPEITFKRARNRILKAAEISGWLRDGLRHYAEFRIMPSRLPIAA